MTVDVIGIDHIYIAVSDLARAEAFYDRVFPLLGFRKNTFSINQTAHIQYYNRHFGYVLRPAYADTPAHNPYHSGLHHLCLRVADEAAVNAAATELQAAGIACSDPAHFPEYASDYVAVFFTDPDGIRLEITNYRQERKDRHDHWHART